MSFSAYTIVENKSNGMKVSTAGLVMFVILITAIMLFGMGNFVPVVIVIALVVFVIGLAMSWRNLSAYTITEEILSVTIEQIGIGSIIYPMSELKELNFYYHSYNGQSHYGYYPGPDVKIEYGIDNYISFVYNDKKVYCCFHLADENHAMQLLAMFHEMRESGVAFTAHDRFLHNY